MSKALIERLSTLLVDHGIDIIHPFNLARYNNYLPKEAAGIPSTILDDAVALLIGNTKFLWPYFIKYLADTPSLIENEHPLDTYIEHSVQSALDTLSTNSILKYRVFYSHIPVDHNQDDGGGYYYVAMQHCAQASGLAYLDPSSHISLHPDYGPWFALRAVVVFDSVKYSNNNNATQQQQQQQQPPISPHLKCPVSPKTEQHVKMLFESALKEQNSTNDGDRDRDNAIGEGKRYHRAHWEKWAAVREATSSRHANKWRYSASQLKYHYTSDKKVLMEEVDRWSEERKKSV
jgi:cyanocobalamin reductase (cyanide-eliminating) / alkylcobalamin dealkylase